MKLFSRILSVILLFWVGLFGTYASAWLEDYITDGSPSVPYCQWEDCTVEKGIEETKNISSVVTNKKASEYIQDVTAYVLWFMAIVAVIYIIYAGFNILVWNGDEEKIKKSKSIIIYVVLGLIIMFLAYSIVAFLFDLLDSGVDEPELGGVVQEIMYS